MLMQHLTLLIFDLQNMKHLTFQFASIGIVNLLASTLLSIRFMFKIWAIELQIEKRLKSHTVLNMFMILYGAMSLTVKGHMSLGHRLDTTLACFMCLWTISPLNSFSCCSLLILFLIEVFAIILSWICFPELFFQPTI